MSRLLESRKVHDLGHLEDISEYLNGEAQLKGYATSDSEFEDEDHCVTLAQDFKAGGVMNKRNTQSFVKLKEIGPRLNLTLLKIEDDAFSGEVQYHSYIKKTEEEVAELKQIHAERAELKRKRIEEQEENVKRKQEAEEAKREKRAEKRRRREERRAAEEADEGDDADDDADDDDDDANDIDDNE